MSRRFRLPFVSCRSRYVSASLSWAWASSTAALLPPWRGRSGWDVSSHEQDDTDELWEAAKEEETKIPWKEVRGCQYQKISIKKDSGGEDWMELRNWIGHSE